MVLSENKGENQNKWPAAAGAEPSTVLVRGCLVSLQVGSEQESEGGGQPARAQQERERGGSHVTLGDRIHIYASLALPPPADQLVRAHG